MFQAVGHALEGDHLDLSFHDPSSWTRAGEEIDIPNQWFVVGDPESGPTIMLGAMPAFPADLWFDTHYHGSDQFRAVIKGEYLLQSHRMAAGDFGYQESGRTYREGVSGSATNGTWLFAMHGTWRGARATRVKSNGTFELPELADNQLDRFAELDDPCWEGVPGGPRGIVALETSLETTKAGYAWGSFDDTEGWRAIADGVVAMGGAFGLQETGPILFTVHAAANCVALPAATYGTEIVCALIRGSAQIGDKHYRAGDVRVQKAGVPLDAVVSGPDGLDLVFLVADRRERPHVAGEDAPSQQWKTEIEAFYTELCPA